MVVVELDEEIIRAAGLHHRYRAQGRAFGGRLIYQGNVSELKKNSKQLYVKYLTGEEQIEVPQSRRKWNNFIVGKGARQNNLKNIDVKFPLHVMTVVTASAVPENLSLRERCVF